MTLHDLPEYSVYIVTEYYKNNIRPFLDAFADWCMWIGPAQGQMIRTKEALLAAFSQENHELTFAMQNLHVMPMDAGDSSMEVILHYTIITYYPNGEVITFQQRVSLLWVKELIQDEDGSTRTDFAIRVCHISNEFPYDARDTIYPNHFHELDIAKIYTGNTKMSKFSLKGLYGSYFYLSPDTILWIESKGSHSLIHTTSKVYESLEGVTSVANKFPESLCKIHASFAVNPLYVSEVGRFYVLLEDGTRLSIPEKKYTQTREELRRRIEQLKEAESF